MVRDEWVPPREFDEYRLVRLLGHGSMGHVYLARDIVLDRPVAVKFVSVVVPDEKLRRRFRVEARAAARLQHPNVMAIHRIGELDGRPYLVTEYIRGKSLSEIEMPVPWQRSLEIALGLTRGLAAAHRQGVLHRDIKLANAMIDEEGTVKLLDFSLAKLLDEPLPVSAPEDSGTALVVSRRKKTDPNEDTAPLLEPNFDPDAVEVGEKLDATFRVSSGKYAQYVQDLSASFRKEIEQQRAEMDEDDPRLRSNTSDGTLMGTPNYMAPELWRVEPATRRSDVYAMGALVHYLLTGKPPIQASSPLELASLVQHRDATPIAQQLPGVEPKFAAIVDRCLRRDPADRFRSGEALREALEKLAVTRVADPASTVAGGNPYRGLEAFQAEHRRLFFGRESEIRAVIERLRSQYFVLVAGDSGVGKSSLCRAGILPAICDGNAEGLERGRTWTYTTVTPGRHPLHSLISALTEGLDDKPDHEAIAEALREAPERLTRIMRVKLGTDRGKILFVDQLEELVTLSEPEEAAIVGALLARLAAGISGMRLLATVRGDFLTRVATIPGLGDEIEDAAFLLRPMSPASMREAIVGPARSMGASFESDELVGELVDEGIQGSLPLLQFALAELWEVHDRSTGTITRKALARIGGVTGALARHADDMLAKLLPSQRVAARRLLMRLVTIEDTRATLNEDELGAGDEATRAALEALVRGRLVVSREADEVTVYEIAHEALINGWGTLRQWLDEEKEGREIRRRLEIAAADWMRLGRRRDVLWTGVQLEELSGLDEETLGPRERAFKQASMGRERAKRWRRRLLIASVPVALALALLGLRVKQALDLERQISVMVTRADAAFVGARARVAAEAELLEKTYAAFDEGRDSDGEALWDQVKQERGEISASLREASQDLEAAVALDSSREGTRARLSEVLFERAVFEERRHNSSLRDEYIARASVYDVGGARMSRWSAPARLVLHAAPGAQVTLARYQVGERYTLGPPEALGQTPIEALELDPGSYLFTLTREGYAPARLPVLVARGESLELEVPMLSERRVPEGFVYVPGGRFLLGSSVDDQLRREFLHAPPQHQVEVDGFLIGRKETTFGEYLEYLDSLSPEAQAERQWKIEPTFGDIGIESSKDERGWVFEFYQDDEHRMRVRPGELLTYAARSERATQDWTAFPVCGISAVHAREYLRWLRETGRVPGARLCTSVEWEWAARGADGRVFAHGDTLSPSDANIMGSHGEELAAVGPDETGSFELENPFGLLDASGNVWEWVAQGDGVNFRGGGYTVPAFTSRLSNRVSAPEDQVTTTVGLRVCASIEPDGARLPPGL